MHVHYANVRPCSNSHAILKGVGRRDRGIGTNEVDVGSVGQGRERMELD